MEEATVGATAGAASVEADCPLAVSRARRPRYLTSKAATMAPTAGAPGMGVARIAAVIGVSAGIAISEEYHCVAGHKAGTAHHDARPRPLPTMATTAYGKL